MVKSLGDKHEALIESVVEVSCFVGDVVGSVVGVSCSIAGVIISNFYVVCSVIWCKLFNCLCN